MLPVCRNSQQEAAFVDLFIIQPPVLPAEEKRHFVICGHMIYFLRTLLEREDHTATLTCPPCNGNNKSLVVKRIRKTGVTPCRFQDIKRVMGKPPCLVVNLRCFYKGEGPEPHVFYSPGTGPYIGRLTRLDEDKRYLIFPGRHIRLTVQLLLSCVFYLITVGRAPERGAHIKRVEAFNSHPYHAHLITFININNRRLSFSSLQVLPLW